MDHEVRHAAGSRKYGSVNCRVFADYLLAGAAPRVVMSVFEWCLVRSSCGCRSGHGQFDGF